MPYGRVGSLKISDHHVRSPLLNINRACQTCHKWSEQELLDRAETIQTRTFQTRNIAMDALVDLIKDIESAQKAGMPEDALAKARDLQKRAQFYLDFVEAENSMGFHADQESVRILSNSINFSRLGQNALRPGGGASTSPTERPAGAPGAAGAPAGAAAGDGGTPKQAK